MTPALLTVDDVSYTYPDGTAALGNCSLSFQQGSRTALLGANGAGKTTLFLHLNGILRPSSGRVLWKGGPLDYSRQGLRALRSQIGLVFQNPDNQLFSASVREDVSFGPMNLGLQEQIVRERVEEALALVGMTESAERPVHNLSFGQKKRVCIAGILAMQPDVIILDEPMAGLDAAMQKDLASILERLHCSGMTLIIATHDLDFAYGWADRLEVLVCGKCETGFDTASIQTDSKQLAELSIGLPNVLKLYNVMVQTGILTGTDPPPRSHDQLQQMLASRSS